MFVPAVIPASIPFCRKMIILPVNYFYGAFFTNHYFTGRGSGVYCKQPFILFPLFACTQPHTGRADFFTDACKFVLIWILYRLVWFKMAEFPVKPCTDDRGNARRPLAVFLYPFIPGAWAFTCFASGVRVRLSR